MVADVHMLAARVWPYIPYACRPRDESVYPLHLPYRQATARAMGEWHRVPIPWNKANTL